MRPDLPRRCVLTLLEHPQPETDLNVTFPNVVRICRTRAGLKPGNAQHSVAPWLECKPPGRDVSGMNLVYVRGFNTRPVDTVSCLHLER